MAEMEFNKKLKYSCPNKERRAIFFKMFLIWYHTPFLNRVAMWVAGRGHRFESQNQGKKKPGHMQSTRPVSELHMN
ncbi:MAG: hypothetical protein D3924_10170 [Candidatus Electrothrix sp. AR4]|nr:hypothetical protein [Candidatus Electrothrix sp. AR4]